jgi:hypothetical protein
LHFRYGAELAVMVLLANWLAGFAGTAIIVSTTH